MKLIKVKCADASFTEEELYDMAIDLYRKAGFSENQVREGVGEWAYQTAKQKNRFSSKSDVIREIMDNIKEDKKNR